MSVLLLCDPAMGLHDPGPGHPERPARLEAITRMLDEYQREGVERAKPRAAAREHILRVHAPEYVNAIDALRGRTARLDPDTAVSPNSVEAAYLAAGAAIDAVDHTCTRSGPEMAVRRPAFALVRPPGHHAERNRAMGFCLFNNIAIAATYAIERYGMRRVLIVDWDVHHGNATQHIFENRSDVLFFSSHQYPFYPGTGAVDEVGTGEGEGFTVNAPLPAGLDDAAHVLLYQRLLEPVANHYKPDLVLVSAGFDSHREDPLGGMRLSETGYAALCALVRSIADHHAQGRLALFLEGGYSLRGLAGSVRACIDVLAGDRPPPILESADSQAQMIIDRICAAHRKYWPV